MPAEITQRRCLAVLRSPGCYKLAVMVPVNRGKYREWMAHDYIGTFADSTSAAQHAATLALPLRLDVKRRGSVVKDPETSILAPGTLVNVTPWNDGFQGLYTVVQYLPFDSNYSLLKGDAADMLGKPAGGWPDLYVHASRVEPAA